MTKTEEELQERKKKAEIPDSEPAELTDEEVRQVAGGMVISSTAVPKSQVIKAHS